MQNDLAYYEDTMDAYCSEKYELVKERLRANPWQVTYPDGEAELTFLHEIAMTGENRQLAELLLELGADPNARACHGQLTPLHYASAHANLEIIDVLLQHGADIEARTKSGYTPLLEARTSRTGRQKEIIDFLLSRGAKLDINTAICTQRIDEVRKIIETDPNWEKNAPFPTQLLHDAIFTGNLELVRLLLDSGISPTKPDTQNRTPLQCAKNQAWVRGNWDIVNLLRERAATK